MAQSLEKIFHVAIATHPQLGQVKGPGCTPMPPMVRIIVRMSPTAAVTMFTRPWEGGGGRQIIV